MKVKKSDWALINEAKKNGMLVSMNGIVSLERTDLNKRLEKYFRENFPGYSGFWNEFEGEDILYNINSFIRENEVNIPSLDFPLNGGDNTCLIPITNNLKLEVLAVDECFGSGDHEKYVSIEHFVITEEATEKDIDELIEFIQIYLL